MVLDQKEAQLLFSAAKRLNRRSSPSTHYQYEIEHRLAGGARDIPREWCHEAAYIVGAYARHGTSSLDTINRARALEAKLDAA